MLFIRSFIQLPAIKLVFLFTCLMGSVAQMASAQTQEEAMQLLEHVVGDTLKQLQANQGDYQKNPDKVVKLLKENILPYVDFDAMARLVLAKHWKEATVEQQQAFSAGFQNMLMGAYASKLTDYADSVVVYGKASEVVKNRTKVTGNIKTPDGKKYAVLLSLGYHDNTWKAYDVSLDGVSFVASFRSSMDEKINREGLEKVIVDLQKSQGHRE